MNIPIKISTICGNIAKKIAGITPNSAKSHKTPYITNKTPNKIAILYPKSFKSYIGIPPKGPCIQSPTVPWFRLRFRQ